MKIADNQRKLFIATNHTELSKSLHGAAKLVSKTTKTEEDTVVMDIILELNRIKARNNGNIPMDSVALQITTFLKNKYSGKIVRKKYNISIGNGFLYYEGETGDDGEPSYEIVPIEMASEFSSYASAEKVMRELWLEGHIIERVDAVNE